MVMVSLFFTNVCVKLWVLYFGWFLDHAPGWRFGQRHLFGSITRSQIFDLFAGCFIEKAPFTIAVISRPIESLGRLRKRLPQLVKLQIPDLLVFRISISDLPGK